MLYSPSFGNPHKRASELFHILQEKNLKIGFVECSVGGFISNLIVRNKGASKVFVGAIIPYSYELKEFFGLKSDKGAVSEEFTNLCAGKFFSLSGADIVVAESSILGPEGGTPEKPVGLSFVSVVSKKGKTSFVNVFRGNRQKVMQEIAAFSFFAAKNHVIGWEFQSYKVASSFIEHKGKILIMKRSKKVKTYKGHWGVASGYIEEGETPLQTALKEIKEETSIDVGEVIDGTPFEVVDEKIQVRWEIYPFRVVLDSPPTPKIDWEHTEFKIIKPSDIHKFKTAPMLYEGYLKTIFRF